MDKVKLMLENTHFYGTHERTMDNKGRVMVLPEYRKIISINEKRKLDESLRDGILDVRKDGLYFRDQRVFMFDKPSKDIDPSNLDIDGLANTIYGILSHDEILCYGGISGALYCATSGVLIPSFVHNMDRQGRLLIPAKARKDLLLEDKVILNGRYDHFAITRSLD